MSRGNFQSADYLPAGADPKNVGLLDQYGNPLLSNGRKAVGMDGTGRLVDFTGRQSVALPYTDAAGEAVVWMPLLERSNGFSDASGQLGGTISGGAMGNRFANLEFAPGPRFNGTNNRIALTTGTQGGFIHNARRIGDLKSLTYGVDMVLLWAVISHPATIPADGTILSWGCNNEAKGGWAFGVKATSGKITFNYRPKGGAATTETILGVEGARGASSDNRRTVVALEIFRSTNGAYNELRGYQKTLYTDGGNGQNNTGTSTAARALTGTAVDYDTLTPLMIGAWCDTSAATFTKLYGSNTVGNENRIYNVGAIRRPLKIGIGMAVCRDIALAHTQFPLSAR